VRQKALEAFLLSLPGAELSIQWGDDRIFKIGGKMFAATGPNKPNSEARVSFKCSDLAFEMLSKRRGLMPARYLARAKWVTLDDPKAMDADELKARLAEAHRLVAEKLPKKTRAALGL
jgi:predicted DNA-binding protein (MmcQ/YjbR family)